MRLEEACENFVATSKHEYSEAMRKVSNVHTYSLQNISKQVLRPKLVV